MKLQLVDRSLVMCKFWDYHFQGYENVEIYCGDFFDLPTDCIVSPANSFGFMDGGLDQAITNKLGSQVQNDLQKIIKEKYSGELLVGQAELIKTGNLEIPYCISAPTMRVPLLIEDTVNAYLAARAVFLLLKKNPQINSVTISGLGTGVGKMAPETCARQMRQAYTDHWLGLYKFPYSWYEAKTRHELLYASMNPI